MRYQSLTKIIILIPKFTRVLSQQRLLHIKDIPHAPKPLQKTDFNSGMTQFTGTLHVWSDHSMAVTSIASRGDEKGIHIFTASLDLTCKVRYIRMCIKSLWSLLSLCSGSGQYNFVAIIQPFFTYSCTILQLAISFLHFSSTHLFLPFLLIQVVSGCMLDVLQVKL